MQRLHDMGPKTVVLSSTSLGADGELVALASSVKSNTFYIYLIYFLFMSPY